MNVSYDCFRTGSKLCDLWEKFVYHFWCCTFTTSQHTIFDVCVISNCVQYEDSGWTSGLPVLQVPFLKESVDVLISGGVVVVVMKVRSWWFYSSIVALCPEEVLHVWRIQEDLDIMRLSSRELEPCVFGGGGVVGVHKSQHLEEGAKEGRKEGCHTRLLALRYLTALISFLQSQCCSSEISVCRGAVSSPPAAAALSPVQNKSSFYKPHQKELSSCRQEAGVQWTYLGSFLCGRKRFYYSRHHLCFWRPPPPRAGVWNVKCPLPLV